MAPALKPCPFCGSVNVEEQNDVVVAADGDEGYSEWIECGACGGRAPTRQAWNARLQDQTTKGESTCK